MIGSIISAGLKIIDKIIPDAKARTEAKIKLLELEQTGELSIIESQSNIIVSEAKSDSKLASSWRPLIMLLFGVIIANNYILSPWLAAFGGPHIMMQIPPKMWTLIEIGLGGYVFGRSAEKIASKFAN